MTRVRSVFQSFASKSPERYDEESQNPEVLITKNRDVSIGDFSVQQSNEAIDEANRR